MVDCLSRQSAANSDTENWLQQVEALMLPTAANAEVAMVLRQDPNWRLPPLWRSEFRQVLLKYVRSDLAKPEQALALWHKALERFELSEQPVAGHQVLALAIATGCSTYDAEPEGQDPEGQAPRSLHRRAAAQSTRSSWPAASSRCTETMRMGQQGREGDGRQGARACAGFMSALASRPAPVQAQAAFADPASQPSRPGSTDIDWEEMPGSGLPAGPSDQRGIRAPVPSASTPEPPLERIRHPCRACLDRGGTAFAAAFEA